MLPISLPDIKNKPIVMTCCYMQDWHKQLHVRLQVVVSRVPTSFITMMQQPIIRESEINCVGVLDASHCTMAIHKLHLKAPFKVSCLMMNETYQYMLPRNNFLIQIRVIIQKPILHLCGA